MEMIEQGEAVREIAQSIKVTKNTKGYNWEIRVFIKNDSDLTKQEEFDQEAIDRIAKIDGRLNKDYGGLMIE